MEKKFKDWFNEFYERQGHYIAQNKLREENRIKDYFNDDEKYKTLDDIDSKIKNNKQLSQLMIKFYRYIKKEHKYDHDSCLFDIYTYDTVDRQLSIAKFLHKNPTKEDILTEFGISDKTLNNDLDALRSGITLQKNTIQLKIENGEHLKCSTTIHPIFLPLNMTEIYVLVKILPSILKKVGMDKPECKFILNRLEKIKYQLSDYALEILFDENEIEEINNSRENWSFTEENDLVREKNDAVLYYLKLHTKCKFEIDGKPVVGYIKIRDDLYIETEEGEEICNVEVVDALLGPCESVN